MGDLLYILLLSAVCILFFFFLHSNKPHVSFIFITERKSKFFKNLSTAFPLAFWPKFAQSPLQRDAVLVCGHMCDQCKLSVEERAS